LKFSLAFLAFFKPPTPALPAVAGALLFEVRFLAYQEEENPMKQMFRFLQQPLNPGLYGFRTFQLVVYGARPRLGPWSRLGGEFRPRRRSCD
jgi:hypothetical protein